MIDTLMVLWTRGMYSRFWQTLTTFLLLFVGICVLLSLMITSGVHWPGLAGNVVPSGATPTATTPRTMLTTTSGASILPIILQNPTAEPAIPTPYAVPTHPPQYRPGHARGHHSAPIATPAATKTPRAIPSPTPRGQ